MRRILSVLLILFVAVPIVAQAWTLQWGPPTKYTDGSAITRPITYTVWDNSVSPTVPLASGITVASYPLSGVGSGVAHRYEVAAVVDSIPSERVGVSWTSPFQVPETPGAAAVVP